MSDDHEIVEIGDFRQQVVNSIMTSTATLQGMCDNPECEAVHGEDHFLEVRLFTEEGQHHVLLPPQAMLALMAAIPHALAHYFGVIHAATSYEVPDSPDDIPWGTGDPEGTL